MPYKTQVTIEAKTVNVDKTAKKLEEIDKTLDQVNKKSLNVKGASLPGLSEKSLEELKELLNKAESIGLGQFKPDIMQEIASRQAVSPEVGKEIGTEVAKAAKETLGGLNIKGLIGGLLGFQSIAALVKQIASKNENLTAAVQTLIESMASFLQPVLDFIAGLISGIAKFIAPINKSAKTTAAAATKQLAGFDEINNLTTGKESGSGNSKTSAIQKSAEDFINGLLEMLKGVLEVIGGVIAAIYYGPIMLVQSGFALITAGIGLILSTITGLFAGIIAGAIGFFQGFIDGFKKARDEGKGIIVSILTGLWNGLKTGFNNFVAAFKNGFLAVWTWVKDKVITPITNAISTIYNKAFKPALQMILNGAGKIVNGFVGMVNSIVSVLNKIPGINLGYLSRWNVPQLAGGGMVDRGQLFVANENGAEMIGSFGNKTAVANNEQIIEGIKRGVEEAMQGSNQTIQLVVDGTVLSSVVVNNIRKQNRIMGRSVI